MALKLVEMGREPEDTVRSSVASSVFLFLEKIQLCIYTVVWLLINF